MIRRALSVFALVYLASSLQMARADDAANAVLDKAIKALGGEEKLKGAKAITWAAKGTLSFGGNDNPFSTSVTAQGLSQYQGKFSGDFNGNQFEAVTVINGDKGWRKFGDMTMEMDEDALATEKRNIYLRLIPTLILPLKGEGFKAESGGEEKEGDITHNVVKVTGPEGKSFRLYFDKESSLPVKLVATVPDFMGEEYEQTTTYKDFKDFGGIMKATKIEILRDGERLMEENVSEFKAHESVDAAAFKEPE